MSAQHGYGLFEWLRMTFGWTKEHKPTGWQRNRKDEQQDTGGYQLPDILGVIAGGAPVHCAPGEWAHAYHLQHGHTPIPPTPQDTGDIPRCLSARERHNRRVLSGKLTEPNWLYANIPTGALPERYGNAPVQRRQTGPIATNTGRLDGIIAGIQDLPTVPDYNRIVSDKLSKLGPPIPLPAAMVAAFVDDAWLHDMPQTVLNRQPTGSLAVADKTACNPLGVTSKDCQPNLDDVTPTEECPRVRFEKIIRQLKKESE